MQKFDTTAPVSAVLDIPAGRIQVIAADRSDATVEIRPADASKSRDVKAAEQTEVAYEDGVLRIKAPTAKNQYFGASGSIEVTLQLPVDSRIEAKAAAAEFRAVGRCGDVTFEGAQGSTKIDEAASVHLTALAGDVQIGRLNGPAEISTQKGDIRIDEALRGTVVLSTQMGDISISTPASASLDAGTGYGRIDNTLRNAEGPTPALTVRATTGHGDITAHSL
ncbi:hypothetical protein RKD23_003501 [Streptomyces sp. SAI-170]|uniref:DUF4097 family beta strand repeat-containing protein n=1 Tax=Streptomyces sp. SAI-170 TaxID=3377729 RepID=UPI003C7BBE64